MVNQRNEHISQDLLDTWFGWIAWSLWLVYLIVLKRSKLLEQLLYTWLAIIIPVFLVDSDLMMVCYHFFYVGPEL